MVSPSEDSGRCLNIHSVDFGIRGMVLEMAEDGKERKCKVKSGKDMI
jgi:hypothetical protein